MRIFLSSRYSRREEMRSVAAELHRLGHTVTSRWIHTDWQPPEGESQSSHAPPELREEYALKDRDDLLAADCCIAFTEGPGGGGRGGRHVEFGMAAARGKRLIVVGHRENIFHHLPGVEFFKDRQRLMNALEAEYAKSVR